MVINVFFPAFRLIGLIWPRDADVEMEAYQASKGETNLWQQSNRIIVFSFFLVALRDETV